MFKKTFLVLLGLLLVGSLAFAQYSDDSFDDGSGGKMEAFVGFHFAIDIVDGENRTVPAITAGYRQYFMDLSDTMHLGAAAFVSYGFLPEEMYGVKMDFDSKMNIGALVGVSLQGDIGDFGLGFVVDLGLAGNIDIYTENLGYKFTYEYTIINLGPGLNAALQYRLPMGSSALIFELGANFSYCINISYEKGYYYDGTKVPGWTYTGDGDGNALIRIAPYLTVGWKF